jgi:transglutaminase-like putative cysteine protease
MTVLEIDAELSYEVTADTSFAFSVCAAQTAGQKVLSESVEITPDVEVERVPSVRGTQQLIRLEASPGELHLAYRATVAIDTLADDPMVPAELAFASIPPEVLPYLNPSRYCESDKLGDFAWRHFGATEPGYGRVSRISSWVGESILYTPGSTDASSSATDVLLQRAGVCRDYAHVAITLCRALGVPARYVSGYALGLEPQDFHGFFEAYLGGNWYLFDPTGMTLPNGVVRIRWGRDAADAPFATLVGRADLVDMSVVVKVAEP